MAPVTNDALAWDWDIATDVVRYSDGLCIALCLTADQGTEEFALLEKRIHPQDHDRTLRHLHSHLAGFGGFETEFRLLTGRGGYRWFEARATTQRNDSGDPITLRATLKDTTERNEAAEALKISRERLKLLARITGSVVGTATLEEQARRMAADIRSALGVDLCVIRVLEGDQLVLFAEDGVQTALLMPAIHKDDGIAGRILSRRVAMAIPDVAKESALSQLFTTTHSGYYEFRSYAGAPLILEDEILGVLGVFTTHEVRTFSAEDLEYLQIIGNHAAVAIANGRLYKQVEAQRSALEEQIQQREHAQREAEKRSRHQEVIAELGRYALNEPDTAALFNRAVEVAYAALDLQFCELFQGPESESQAMLAIAVWPAGTLVLRDSDEFARFAFQHDELVICNSLAHETRFTPPHYLTGARLQAAACAVIHAPDERFGVICAYRDKPDSFDQNDTLFLRNICNVLSASLNRKLAEERLQQKIGHMDALRMIDLAITASLDLRITLNVLLDQVIEQLRVDAATVLLLNRHTQTLEFAAGRGLRSSVLRYTTLKLGEGHAGQAALRREVVTVQNLKADINLFGRAPLFAAEEFVSYVAAPLVVKGHVEGVLEIFQRRPLRTTKEWLDFLQALAGQAAIAIHDAELFNDLERSNAELRMAYDTTLLGWSRALELRDKETQGHTQRATDTAEFLARSMGFNEADIIHIRRGSLLHDIGKMGIPDEILLKPGPLNEDEWEIMRKHPIYAYELLSPIEFLRPALDIPYCHHEKWDGSGYPRGLKGEQIPPSARIFAVVDVWDALRSDRPYRTAWEAQRVRDHIKALGGSHFDPAVLEAFLALGVS